MATTPKGIYYPNDYNEIADIPEDMKKMAESIDGVFENTDSDLSDIKEEQTTQNNRLNSLEVDNTTNKSDILTNKQEINNIKTEQTTQNNRLNNLETDNTTNKDNISANTQEINNIKQEQTEQNTNISTNATNIESLQEENESLKKIVSQLPQVEGQGTSITLENTIEAQFTKFDVEGNSVQDGTPSPDNEVPIYSAGDNENICPTKEFTSSSRIRIVSNETEYGAIVQGIAVGAGTYVASFDVTTLPTSDYRIQFIASSDSTQSQSAVDITNPIDTITKTCNQLGSYFVSITVAQNCYLYLRCVPAGFTLDSIKIEKGNKATPYSPYGMGSINEKITNADGTEEQDYSIPVQQSMRSNKDKTIKDKFVIKSDNKKYERHWIGEVVLNGTEEVYLYNDNGSRAVFYINVADLYDYTNSAETPELLSNRFRPVSQTATWEPGGIACRIGGRAIFFIFETGTSVNEFKNWLSTHNVVVQYLLAEPLDLPCTPEQIQQLENLPSTYKDFTIIQSQDETPAYLEVSGIYDMNKLITRVEVLESEV